MVDCGKLLRRILFEFGVVLFDHFVYRQNVTCLEHFTRYGHCTGDVEEIIIGRLSVVFVVLCQKLQRLFVV